MKQLFVLTGALLFINVAFAQNIAKRALEHSPHNHTLSILLGKSSNASAAAAKTTAGVSMNRVIAQSTWDFTSGATVADSVKLGYAGTHYSIYDYNFMLYTYNYQYGSTPVFNNAEGIFAKPQVLYDTMTRWQIDPNTLTFGYYETAYATYNSNLNLTDYTDLFADSVFNPNVRYTNKFNKAKNIDTGYTYRWHSGIADNTFRQFYTYNATNVLTADSIYELHLGVWRLASATAYTYDGTGNLIQIDNYANTTDTSFLLPLTEKFKYVNTYDASRRLLTVASSIYNGTALIPSIRDTFAYTGSLTYHSSWKEHQFDPINGYWAPMFYMHKSINTSTNQPDTVYIDGFDSLLNKWVPQTRNVMVYNANHDPLRLLDYEYNFTAFPGLPDFITTYYYATYLNTVEAQATVKSVANMLVFPNPATDQITISGIEVPQNSSVLITLINTAGQVVSRSGLQWSGQAQLPVRNLVPGVYQTMVQDGNGNILGRQSFVKQ